MNKSCRSVLGRSILLFITLILPLGLRAQRFADQPAEEKELSPVSRTYAITHATVIQAPGKKMDRSTVVIRDGLIAAVGKNVSVPPEAIIINGDSLYVYAGFIDGLSRVGITKPKEDQNRGRPKDPGNPDPELAGITPQHDVRAFLNPADKSIEELRALGFTAAQVVPYGKMLPGSASVVLLAGKDVDKMVLSNTSALFSEFAGATRMYPSTIMGVMAKWRELYRQAVQTKNYETMYASNPAGLPRPASDRIREAFYPVIEKQIPVLFEADRSLEIHRAITLQSELGFAMMLGDVKEGWNIIPKIKSSGAKVFLSLELPEEKKESDKGNKEASSDSSKKEHTSTLTPDEKAQLEKRNAEAIALRVVQASTFHKAGVIYGFSSLSVKTSDIRANLRRMIRAGLTEDQALAALTVNPAQLLGLSARLGTIDNGKIANLVISDKPYFDEKAKVRYVFVDGMSYKYDPKDVPKADPDAKTEIAGTWTVTTATPQDKSEQTLTIRKEGSKYTGSIFGGSLSESVPLDRIELSGNGLKYSYTVQMSGQTFKVDVTATVEGDTFKGTAHVGQYESFPVEGKREPRAPQQK